MSHRSDSESKERSTERGLILTFHKVQKSFSFGATNYAPRRLENLLRLLLNRGFRFVSLEDAISSDEPTNLALTFDDGYAHLADVLPRLMDLYGVKPTVFIPTAFIGKRNSWDYSSFFQSAPHMDSATIKELAGLGVEFGAHGHKHLRLTQCDQSELKQELQLPFTILENILGSQIQSVSYPFGSTNDAVMDQAQTTGYKYGLTMKFPDMKDRPMALGRLPIYGFDTQFDICQKLEHGPVYRIEQVLSKVANNLSIGNSLWRWVSGK